MIRETDIETPSMGLNKARVDEPREGAENMALQNVFLSRQTDISLRVKCLNKPQVEEPREEAGKYRRCSEF